MRLPSYGFSDFHPSARFAFAARRVAAMSSAGCSRRAWRAATAQGSWTVSVRVAHIAGIDLDGS